MKLKKKIVVMLSCLCSASQQLNKAEALNQDAFRATRRVGFTLVELLVVVLIIGILSAIAIPQYQKAVWKSRATQSLVLVKNLANAQEVYFLENGTYATKFSDLIFDFDVLPNKEQGASAVSSGDAFRHDDNITLIVNVYGNLFVLSRAIFKTGPYTGCGFVFHHRSTNNSLSPRTLYCAEAADKINKGDFCQKVMNASSFVTSEWNVRFFALS